MILILLTILLGCDNNEKNWNNKVQISRQQRLDEYAM